MLVVFISPTLEMDTGMLVLGSSNYSTAFTKLSERDVAQR